MSGQTLVVALGGNALAPPGERATIANQFRHTRESLAPIVDLARDGWRIAIVHGNGPQVGDSLARNELAAHEVEPLPLGVLVAETAGWIGYMIQQSLQNALERAGIGREVVTVITQTLVDRNDPSLEAPVKPIGHELSPERRARLEAQGIAMAADPLGRWRRLTASPIPIGVVEAPIVRRLVEQGTIVVAAGGGGPPVYRDPVLRTEGVDAVVDKDRTAAILARDLGADLLLILTDIDAVYRDYGTPRATPIRRITAAEAERLQAAGQFGAGSMRPKVEAAVAFARTGGRAIIAELSQGLAAIRGETGTTILPEDR
ncbi:MAG TPA: carbamate kinase [Gemmatimonadales bacterium]|nr:carbamate kinase [Gemmatimonadales bacterium]